MSQVNKVGTLYVFILVESPKLNDHEKLSFKSIPKPSHRAYFLPHHKCSNSEKIYGHLGSGRP